MPRMLSASSALIQPIGSPIMPNAARTGSGRFTRRPASNGRNSHKLGHSRSFHPSAQLREITISLRMSSA
jgi:hypothetical protein